MSHPLYDDDPKPPEPRKKREAHPLSDEPSPPSEREPRQAPALIIQQTSNPFLTYALIGINLLIFAYANFLVTDTAGMVSASAVVQFSVFPPYIFEQGELYRLFTGMFFHGSIFHILFNMYALYIIGASVERTFGLWRYAIVYFLGGLGGSVVSALLGDYYVPSIGASGAVFAVWAAEALHVYRHRRMYGGLAQNILINTGFFLLLNLFLGVTNPQIDNWGHIGGFIGGGVLAYFIGPRYAFERRTTADGRWGMRVRDDNPLNKSQLYVGAYVLGLLALLSLGMTLVIPNG